MYHFYSMPLDDYNPTMGATFWSWRRELMSEYAIRVMMSSATFHLLATSDTLELAERERLENSRILIV